MSFLKILNAKARNFGPYLEVELDFEQGLCLIEGWNFDEGTSNGSGKTFLLDLISYALFDEVPRDLKVDEIINEDRGKDCYIEVSVELNGDVYQIIKTRKPNDAYIIKNGEEQPRGKDLKETRQIIQDIIKFDYNTFINSIYLSQGGKSEFIALSDPKKQEILTQVLDLSIFDKAYKIASKKIKDIESEYSTITVKGESISHRINELHAEISQLQAKANSFENDKQKEILDKNQEIANTEQYIKDLNDELLTVQNEVLPAIPEKPDLSQETLLMNQLDSKLTLKNNVTDQVNQVNSQIFAINQQIGQLDSEVKQVESVGEGKCSHCKQIVSGDHLLREIGIIKSTKADLVSSKASLEQQLQQYQEVLSKFTEIENQKQQLQQEIFQKEGKHNSEVTTIAAQNKQIEQRILTLKNDIQRYGQSYLGLKQQLEKIQNKTNDYLEMIDDKTSKLEQLGKDLQSIFDNRTLFETQMKKYDVLKRMYKNIKYYVFANMVESLNDKIRYYLDRMFKGSIEVNLSTETTDSKGEVKQKFQTQILKDQKKRSYNSLSGGEKQRVKLATSFAFADVLSHRSTNSLNVLFLDEILGEGLDGEGAAVVVDLLEEMKKDKNIFIIDHHEYVKVLVDNVIRVEKRNNISELMQIA